MKITAGEFKDRKLGIAQRALVIIGLILPFGYLLSLLPHLKMTYFDTYWIFLNARYIAEGQGITFYWGRPPLLSILLSLFSGHGLAPEWTETISRYLSLMFWGGLLWVSYRLYRLDVNAWYGLGGCLLLSTNILLIHFAPFYREDIPGALFVAATFYFYLRYEDRLKNRYLIFAGLAVVGAMMTRYQLALSLVPFLLIWIMKQSYLGNRNKGKAILGVSVFPIMVFLIICAWMAAHLEHVPWAQTLGHLYGKWKSNYAMSIGSHEPPIENIFFLGRSMTWPVLALAVWGAAHGIYKRERSACFHALWVSILFIIHTFVFEHKEARYLFPAFVSLYYLSLRGILNLTELLKHRLSLRLRMVKWVATVCLGAALVGPFYAAQKEYRKFADPFYSSSFMKRASELAGSIAGNATIYWAGNLYALYPKDFYFDGNDEFTYIYHFFIHAVHFYTGKRVQFKENIPFFYLENEAQDKVFVSLENVEASDGDIFIANLAPLHFQTHHLPKPSYSLLLTKTRWMVFRPSAVLENGDVRFTSVSSSAAEMMIKKVPAGYDLHAEHLPQKYVQVYWVGSRGRTVLKEIPFLVKDGWLEVQLGEGWGPETAQEIRLLDFVETQEIVKDRGEGL